MKRPGWLAMATWAQRKRLAEELAVPALIHFEWHGLDICGQSEPGDLLTEFAGFVTCGGCRRTTIYALAQLREVWEEGLVVASFHLGEVRMRVVRFGEGVHLLWRAVTPRRTRRTTRD